MTKKKSEQLAIKNPVGRPKLYTRAEDMRIAIEKYFADCEINNKPLTINGLALSIGMCRDTLLEYSKSGEFSDTVKKAKQTVEESVERRLMTGGNAAGNIFWLKNNAGWRDVQNLEHTGNNGEPIKTESEVSIRPKLTRDEWLKLHGID